MAMRSRAGSTTSRTVTVTSGRRPQSGAKSSVSTRAGFAPATRLDVQKAIAAAQKKKSTQGVPKKKKPTPSAKSTASGATSFSRALSVFSPSSPHLVPSLTACGKAFPVMGMYRKTVEHPLNQRRVYFFSNTGVSANVMLIGAMDVTGVNPPGWETWAAPTVALDDVSGGPTAGRAMKIGATVVNSTAKLTAAGRVFVLNSDQRLLVGDSPSNMTRPEFNAMCDSIVNHPHAKEYSGAEFSKAHSWHAHVVDPVHYDQFAPWQGATNFDLYASHFMNFPSPTEHNPRSMSILCMVFESPPAAQSYTISGKGAWYTRWPLTSVLGQTDNVIPTTSQDAMNRHFTHAAASAHEPLIRLTE